MFDKIKKVGLTNWIMIGMVLGAIVGFIVGPTIEPIGILGDIFIRLIQMSVTLMIFLAVIEAVGSLDPVDLGKLGAKMFGWFAALTVVGATIGVVFALVFQPGVGVATDTATQAIAGTDMTIYDTIIGFFPNNIMGALADGNMIQVIVFAILFGLGLSMIMKEDPDNMMLKFVTDANTAVQRVIGLVMNFAPIGIFAIIAQVVGTSGLDVILSLGKFLLVFLAAATVHLAFAFVITSLKAGVNPWHVVKKTKNMFIIAVTTTSSSVALPTKMEDSEKLFGMSKRINGLVNPLGTALNSNGLSMYLGIAVVFLAQIYEIEMPLSYLVYAVALSSLATMGTVTVPGGGIVALTVVVPYLGLPAASIGLLAGIDWFSGMIRTPLNTIIDALVAMVISADEDELDYEVFNSTL